MDIEDRLNILENRQLDQEKTLTGAIKEVGKCYALISELLRCVPEMWKAVKAYDKAQSSEDSMEGFIKWYTEQKTAQKKKEEPDYDAIVAKLPSYEVTEIQNEASTTTYPDLAGDSRA